MKRPWIAIALFVGLLFVLTLLERRDARATNIYTGSTGGWIDVQASSAKGSANGYAGLDANGKVPSAQLPASGGSEAFPVGALFFSTVSTDPATLLGYGSWSAYATGRVVVGIDGSQTEFDAAGETGGAKTHTLTAAEMPSHTHVQDAHTHVQDAHSHGMAEGTTDGSGTFMDRSNAAAATTATTDAATATNQNATATNQNTGGGGAHNNLQPYIVVYIWKRDS